MLVVQKYGGTSVGNLDRIRAVADHVVKTKQSGKDVVVVVSAMSGETNRLLDLVGSLSQKPSARESDLVVATGEQVSVGLVAMAINDLGEKALPMMSFQIPIMTDSSYGNAHIHDIDAEKIKKSLKSGHIVVIPGFQGVDNEGNVTTLGRGGSDTSAVAVAAALKADLCEIYTDVDGINTTDPNVYPQAQKLKEISSEELLEMAGAGAKVVHLRAVELAANHNIPMQVRSSFDYSSDGTRITTSSRSLEAPVISTISNTIDDAKISIRRVPEKQGIEAAIFTPLAGAGIAVDTIVKNVGRDGFSEIAFTIGKANLKRALQLAENVAKKVGAGEVEVSCDLAKVSIVGVGMRSHIGVPAKIFDVISKNGIKIHIISSSEIKTSIVIDMKDMERAVRVLHEAFEPGRH